MFWEESRCPILLLVRLLRLRLGVQPPLPKKEIQGERKKMREEGVYNSFSRNFHSWQCHSPSFAYSVNLTLHFVVTVTTAPCYHPRVWEFRGPSHRLPSLTGLLHWRFSSKLPSQPTPTFPPPSLLTPYLLLSSDCVTGTRPPLLTNSTCPLVSILVLPLPVPRTTSPRKLFVNDLF